MYNCYIDYLKFIFLFGEYFMICFTVKSVL